MRRREFLRIASVSAGAGAFGASATAAAQQTTTTTSTPTGGTTTAGGTSTETPGGGNATGTATGGGGDVQETVPLVDYAFEGATESPLTITPGTTVRFVWETSSHNINVDQKPAESDWSGVPEVKNAGFETSHTFTVTGEYRFWCDPHKSLGMIGDITVEEGAMLPGEGGGGGGGEVDPEEMGVPFQAHFVGLATLLGIFVSLVFTFFFLKYGETPHSGYPKER
jgi:plastocyanin